MIVRIILILVFLCWPSFSFAAYEGLTELDDVRVARKSSNTFYSGEDSSNYYVWQPQTVSYKDTTTGHEVWFWTQTDNEDVMSYATGGETYVITEWPWRLWSADGKRLAFHVTKSAGGITANPAIWFTSRADGTYMRPPTGSSHHCVSSSHRWFGWSPAEADTRYTMGSNTCDEGKSTSYVYKDTISDSVISSEQWVNVGASTTQPKRNITDDGKFADFATSGYTTGPFYFVQLTPSADKGLKISWDVPSCDSNWGGSGGCGSNGLHDSGFYGSGSPEGNYWFYFFYSSPNDSRWRTRIASIDQYGELDFNNDPTHTSDTVSPYDWWGTVDNMDSDEEIQIMHNGVDTTPRPDFQPYNSEGGPLLGHADFDPWGRYVISTDGRQSYSGWHRGPSVWDIGHGTNTPSSVAQWCALASDTGHGSELGVVSGSAYSSWSAWTDWPIIVSKGGIAAKHYTINNATASPSRLGGGIDVFDTHLVHTSSTWSYGGLSPDGTKAVTHTDWLNPTSGNSDLIIGVVYYPYPPEITQVGASGGIVTVSFNWRTDQPSPRTYTTRGWPDEDTDDPPPPRETEKFRLWRRTWNETPGSCANQTDWSPLSTTDADIFTYYDFSDGSWSGGSEHTWSITDTPGDGSYCYMVTSVEWSGLESHVPSNIYHITVSSGAGTGASDVSYDSDPGDLDSPGTSDILTAFNESDTSIIRYYNVYAYDGSPPSTTQAYLIASIPHGKCADGSCYWIDWLGDTGGTTQYIVGAVDSQGNLSTNSSFVTNQAYEHCGGGGNPCNEITPEPTANGQYHISWTDMYSEVSSPQKTISNLSISGGGGVVVQ